MKLMIAFPCVSIDYAQTNFFKQYTYAYFEISIIEQLVCIVFYLVSSCKEVNTFCFAL